MIIWYLSWYEWLIKMPIECFLKLNLQFRPRSRVILKEIKYKTCIQHISVLWAQFTVRFCACALILMHTVYSLRNTKKSFIFFIEIFLINNVLYCFFRRAQQVKKSVNFWVKISVKIIIFLNERWKVTKILFPYFSTEYGKN